MRDGMGFPGGEERGPEERLLRVGYLRGAPTRAVRAHLGLGTPGVALPLPELGPAQRLPFRQFSYLRPPLRGPPAVA